MAIKAVQSELGGDYMESFQPGLSFSPDCRAEISARPRNKILVKYSERLHDGNFSPGRVSARAEISARFEIPGFP